MLLYPTRVVPPTRGKDESVTVRIGFPPPDSSRSGLVDLYSFPPASPNALGSWASCVGDACLLQDIGVVLEIVTTPFLGVFRFVVGRGPPQ